MFSFELRMQLLHGTLSETISSEKKYVKLAVQEVLGIPPEDYYVIHKGKIVNSDEILLDGHCYHAIPRILGGKGGFGSMLRALGAQIEKTTNREACRDLSGRRMRDVNNEKKLRDWAAKAAEREKEKQERRREKRERMLAPKRLKEVDKEYMEEKEKIEEDLDDAFEHGLKRAAAAAVASGTSSSSSSEACCSTSVSGSKKRRSSPSATRVHPKKAKSWVRIDNDGGSSSSDESVNLEQTKPSGESTGSDAVPGEIDGIQQEDLGAAASADPTVQKEETSEAAAAAHDPAKVGQSINLDLYSSADDLCTLGLDVLKAALVARGMKCGGTLKERADRLFSIRGLEPDEIPVSLLAKPTKKK